MGEDIDRKETGNCFNMRIYFLQGSECGTWDSSLFNNLHITSLLNIYKERNV